MAQKTWKSKALRPETGAGMQYHIRCKRGDVARYVLLPGDPERVPLIAALWDRSRKAGSHREHVTYTGAFRGIGISACSTGVGGPSTVCAVEELAAIGADTFIRVGTCAALQKEIQCGDLIIHSGALRRDGSSLDYVDLSYPALASYEVTLALIEAAERVKARYYVGISASTASFYAGQARPGFRGYLQSFTDNMIADLERANVVSFEQEAATIFVLSSLYGLRAGSVCAVFANRLTNVFETKGVELCAKVATQAVEILAGWDRAKKERRRKWWFPSLTSTRPPAPR